MIQKLHNKKSEITESEIFLQILASDASDHRTLNCFLSIELQEIYIIELLDLDSIHYSYNNQIRSIYNLCPKLIWL